MRCLNEFNFFYHFSKFTHNLTNMIPFFKPSFKNVLLLLALFTATYAQAQITTSSIIGRVTDAKNQAAIGALITATHDPSGTVYRAVTGDNGSYTINNAKVGGPYTIIASMIGSAENRAEGIMLQLGRTENVDFVLADKSIVLDGVTINAGLGDPINSSRTGAQTTINNSQITGLPTIKRSFQDFTRTSSQGEGFSFLGMNRLFNNLTVDGSIFTNPFGLDAATPGGQANAQPISLDAIDQIVVNLAPFDVRQSGFTGASVNAVTKSGTNKFKGTAYTYFRNENLIGTRVGDLTITNPSLSYNQSGAAFGGAIVKNKLFFFASYERERRTDPGSTYLAYRPGTNNLTDANVSNVTAADLDLVKKTLKDVYDYDAGAYENYNHQTNNYKISLKLDWNISENHRFNIVYKRLEANRDVLPNPAISVTGRGPNKNTLPFENNSYNINNNLNSFVAELNSTFGAKYANKLQVGYTTFRDFRTSKSAPFPSVDILKNGANYISFGLERFSINNKLDQNVFQISNNFNVYMGKHTLTAGASYEVFDFANSFNLFYYPGYQFPSVNAFADSVRLGRAPFNQDVTNSNKTAFKNDPTTFGQLGLYLQDDIQADKNLRLTFGLRADIPVYVNSLPQQPSTDSLAWYNPEGARTKVQVNKYPAATPLWSPRFGFNWDVNGDRSLQVRGGTGIFTGRIPFVWLGNQSANNFLAPFYTFQLNTTSSDFKFPQVWRTNIAVDKKLGNGFTATLDLIFGQSVNAVVHRNYNMKYPSGESKGADTRQIYKAGESQYNVVPTSPVNGLGSYLDAGLIVLENTDQGSQFNITGGITKTIGKEFYSSLSYSYGQSKDITSNPGEIAANAFQSLPTSGNTNRPQLAYADHDLRHRLVISALYKHEFFANSPTSIGAFFQVVQGGPGEVIGEVGGRYSYVYAGDMNNDGIGGNDLMFVPAKSSDIILKPTDATDTRTSAQLWSQLDAFIAQDPYLSTRRGQISERNGAILPAYAQLDLKLMQDFSIKVGDHKHALQVSFDILNLGNLISPSWGVRPSVNTRTPLSFAGYNAGGEPTYTFPLFNGKPPDKTFNDETTLRSRWQAQIGIRYLFN